MAYEDKIYYGKALSNKGKKIRVEEYNESNVGEIRPFKKPRIIHEDIRFIIHTEVELSDGNVNNIEEIKRRYELYSKRWYDEF